MQAFDTAGHLRAHEGRVHIENRFTCAECSRETSDNTPNDLEPMSTQASFATYVQLQAHIRSRHPPKCLNCSITCSTSRELRRHLEIVHGDVSLGERKVFPCMVSGCDRSFTKKGNLSVHVRTVHNGEKRFVCGESDLTSSKKVEGWNGKGCGKRYGSKLALEQHIRTGHLGLQNAKAERRERLGLDKRKERAKLPTPSTLASLTGEGYAEETRRRIPCFIESCQYRFHRDYDLWIHMRSKHGCGDDETQDLYIRRALLAHQEDDDFMMHGFEGNYGCPDGQPFCYDDAFNLHSVDDAFDENATNMETDADHLEGSTLPDLCLPSEQGPSESRVAIGDMEMIDPELTFMEEAVMEG
jgi:general transcription factor IIIA